MKSYEYKGEKKYLLQNLFYPFVIAIVIIFLPTPNLELTTQNVSSSIVHLVMISLCSYRFYLGVRLYFSMKKHDFFITIKESTITIPDLNVPGKTTTIFFTQIEEIYFRANKHGEILDLTVTYDQGDKRTCIESLFLEKSDFDEICHELMIETGRKKIETKSA